MSLQWRVDEINNYKEVCWITTDKKDENGKEITELNPITYNLIFATMSTGIGRITDENVDEFYARHIIWCRVHGFDQPSIEDVRSHIGLVANVSYETREQWAHRIFVGDNSEDTMDVSITSEFARQFRKEINKVEA